MRLERETVYRILGPFNPGESVSYRNRIYRLLELLDHTTRYGRDTKLLRWETHCIECGEKFTFQTNKSKFSPLVRCKPHRIQSRRSRQ